jgi:hypothetical protein
MNEKEHSNLFRFSLYQENILLCEKIFDADQFNPFTRYSIDIRDILPRSITRLQKVLSRRSYNTVIEYGKANYGDLYQFNQKMINLYPKEYREGMRYNPQPVVQQISIEQEEKTIRGVECKIGFYINDKPIVERTFYVDGFNPVARWSLDLIDEVIYVTNTIKSKILNSDEKNMWDDYDLINMKGLSITQIRELSPSKREEMLRRLKRN